MKMENARTGIRAIRASCVTIARQPPWSLEAPALIEPDILPELPASRRSADIG
jgi:hypothetical protein